MSKHPASSPRSKIWVFVYQLLKKDVMFQPQSWIFPFLPLTLSIFCLVYSKALLLGVQTFRIVWSSWLIDLFIITKYLYLWWYFCFVFCFFIMWALYLKSTLKKWWRYTMLHYLFFHHPSPREVGKSSLATRKEREPGVRMWDLLPKHHLVAGRLLETSQFISAFSQL